MSENVMMALEMMGQGMLGIFVVLGVIALLVLLLQKLDSKKKKSRLFTKAGQPASIGRPAYFMAHSLEPGTGEC